MNYSEFKKQFNFELPSYAEELYESFSAEYDGSPVLTEREALVVAEETGLPEDGKKELIRCAGVINNNAASRICGAFIRYITVQKRKPWQNQIYTEDLFDAEGLEKEQVGWVIVAGALADTIINKKPPIELNRENLNAFRGYSRSCFEKNGYWGILEWSWNMLCAGGCMFLFGVLKFVPGEFGSDFKVITDGKRYVSFACGEHFIDKDGALTNDISASVGKTVYTENNDEYIVNVISRRGVAENKTTRFSKKIWRDFLSEGTHTLNIHIPSGIEYTPERIREAFGTAIDFYKHFYPSLHPAAITGYSWIFAPQLEKVLDENSNILRVNRSVYVIPTKGEYGADCRFLREGSQLQRRIKEQTENGVRFHYSVMYIPINETQNFGNETE